MNTDRRYRTTEDARMARAVRYSAARPRRSRPWNRVASLLADLPFSMPPDEAFLLSPSIMGSERKNISYDPSTGDVANSSLSGPQADRLKAMLRRFGDAAERLLRDLLPGYATSLQRARTSFRPAEIAGRDYSPRHDDRLLHVDAFPSRPMNGRRILRLFCNVAPDGIARSWRVGEPFADFARQFLPRTAEHCRAARGSWSDWASPKDVAANTTGSCCDCMIPENWIPLTSRRTARRYRISGRLDLALLHRSGAACRARRALRTGADVPRAGFRDGASGTLAAARSGTVVRTIARLATASVSPVPPLWSAP